jgi:hypothetical protein
MQARQSIQELRARIGSLERTEKEHHAWSMVAGGIPRGGLVEISGPGKTEAVARLLAEHSGSAAAWIEKDFSLLPSALIQRGVPLDKIFFVEAKAECPWAATLVLRSQIFPFVVYHAPFGEEKELRRFQLLAERSRSTMLLLTEEKPTLAWPIALSLEMEKGEAIVRRRK